jgi:hypothetical protein
VVQGFCETVHQSINQRTFVSFQLKGPSKKAASKEDLRGCLAQVQGRLVEAKKSDIYLQVVFKYHGATDIAKNWLPTEVYSELHNLLTAEQESPYKSEWGTWYPSGSKLGLQSAILTTSSESIQLNLISGKLKTTSVEVKPASSQPVKHDRTKQVPIEQEAPFWKALGLDKKPSKRRQCQKFVEIVSGLIEKQTQNNKSVAILTVDMGCGRGYLTFGLHHFLSQHYSNVLTRGIDMRPKLVAEMNTIAQNLGMQDGLVFETDTIQGFLEDADKDLQETMTRSGEDLNIAQNQEVRVLIALHACDTATDDALWSGIQSRASILVVAPCCHKEIRPQLDRSVQNHPLADVLRFGIYRERLAETVTDTMRALLLEIANYQVQVFEFVGGEDSSKNVIITAVKQERRRSDQETEKLQQRLQALAALHNVHTQRLATWMKQDLGRTPSQGRPLSAKTMPSL